jgi:hypothetical protein
MRTGPNIGKRIREACEILEKLGPSGSRTLADHIYIDPENMGKYCSRAVKHGLMTVERGLGSRSNYSIFTVVPDWREILARRDPKPKEVKREVIHRTRWTGIASVFQMGAR